MAVLAAGLGVGMTLLIEDALATVLSTSRRRPKPPPRRRWEVYERDYGLLVVCRRTDDE